METKKELEFDVDFREYINRRSCYAVMNIDYENRCEYVKVTPDCVNAKSYVHYIELLECNFKANSRVAEYFAVGALFLFVLYLVLAIAIMVNTFFGPALKVISRMMRMNEHLAGITLLAFGNSVSNLVSNIRTVGNTTQPLYANCLANSMVITMVSGGIIAYMRPFQMNGPAILRDLLFFLAAIFMMEYIFKDFIISLIEAISIILLYVTYLTVNITEFLLMKREAAKLEMELEKMIKRNDFSKKQAELRQKVQATKRHTEFSYMGRDTTHSRRTTFSFMTRASKKSLMFDENSTKYVLYDKENPKNYRLFREFFESLAPMHKIDWNESSKFLKAFMIIKAPICFLTNFYLPIVDVNVDKHGWSKLLNCLQIALCPSLGLLVSWCMFAHFIVGFNPLLERILLLKAKPYVYFAFAVTCLAAVIIFFTSRTDVPPPYHIVFTIVTCACCTFLIYVCSSEMDTMISLIGIVLRFSDDFSGATIGAWSNTISDIISNVVIARHGYENMGLAACYGGPFLTTSLSLGIVYCIEVIMNDGNAIKAPHGAFGVNSFVFFALHLFCTLIFISMMNFQSRRSIGIFNIFIYCLFLFMTILCEKEVIHNYLEDKLVDVV